MSSDQPGDPIRPDRLRETLAAADPARAASPVTPEHLEDLMNRALSAPIVADERDADAARRPRRARRVVASAAGVAAIGVAGTLAWATLRGSERPDTTPAVAASYAMPSPEAAGRCRPIDADRLRSAPTALAGRVVERRGDLARLEVTRWYRGGDGARQVVLTAPPGDLVALIGAPDLQPGASYLLTVGADRTVSVCGASGQDTAQLRALYGAAFGR
jgi:hypothetical protein